MNNCKECIHAEMCKWIDELDGRGCDFFDGEQEPKYWIDQYGNVTPLVQPSRKGHCKDCKYFEYDSVANVDGVPLIVAHEICNKWGDGCKTREDGYCFLFESADMR